MNFIKLNQFHNDFPKVEKYVSDVCEHNDNIALWCC